MIVTDQQVRLGRIVAAHRNAPVQFGEFGFLDTIVKAVGGVVKAFTGGGSKPETPATINVTVPPPPPKSPLETPGGVLAVLGATAVTGILFWSLGKN